MIELHFAEEALRVVQAFLQLGMQTQFICRTSLSRIYYAAHHLGRLLLTTIGLTPSRWRRDVHRRVIDELERRFVTQGTMSANAWQTLSQLRTYRIQADYELTLHVREQDVRDAVIRLTEYLNECRRILGVT
ncbi:MAG: hypothetical protein ACE5PV_21730 [Candidatus Poribacteria bacterium]